MIAAVVKQEQEEMPRVDRHHYNFLKTPTAHNNGRTVYCNTIVH